MNSYFVIGNLAESNAADIIRYAGLLRGTESAVQAVSYGLNSVVIMGEIGSVYLNFSLWALAILPAWQVIQNIGLKPGAFVEETSDEKEV